MESVVDFYNDLGFDRNHRNVRDFSTPANRDRWFGNKVATTLQLNYDKVRNVLKPEMEYSEAKRYSYVRITLSDGSTTFAFIDNVEIINDRTVSMSLTVDVWQTYLFDASGRIGFSIGRAYVERKHVDRWMDGSSESIKDLYGADAVDGYLEERFDYELSQPVYGENGEVEAHLLWAVVCHTINEDDTSRLGWTVVPCLDINPNVLIMTEEPTDIVVGEDVNRYLSIKDIMDGTFLKYAGFSSNTVQSVSIVPYCGIPTSTFTVSPVKELNGVPYVVLTYDNTSPYVVKNRRETTVRMGGWHWVWKELAFGIKYPVYENTTTTTTFSCDFFTLEPVNFFPPQIEEFEVESPVSPQYSSDAEKNEPMLYRSPYYEVSLYDGVGQKLFSLPDNFLARGVDTGDSNTVYLGVFPMFSSSGCSLKVVFAETEEEVAEITDHSALAHFSAIGCLAELPPVGMDIVSNGWLDYKYTERDTDRKLMFSQLASKAVGSVATGGIAGSKGGIALGTASGLVDVGTTVIGTVISEEGMRNKANSVTISGSGNGQAMIGNLSPHIIGLRCNELAYEDASWKYRMEGYSINRYHRNVDWHVRTGFDFVKTLDCGIRGSFSEDVREQIASVFNNGVTVWHDDAPMDYDVQNKEIIYVPTSGGIGVKG